MLRKCKFQVILVCTHRQHMCQGQETVGPALSPFPFCWQEGSVQAVQIYCSAPVRLLCLRVGPTSGYQDSKTGDSTEICCQVGHQPLVIGLSGPNPTHELAPSCYTSKEAEAATMQTHPPRRIRYTSFSFHTPSPSFPKTPSLYGTALSKHKNFSPPALIPP